MTESFLKINPPLSGSVVQTNLDKIIRKKFHSKRETATALPGRAAPAYQYQRWTLSAHAPSRPKTGLGADIGMLKTGSAYSNGTVNSHEAK